MYFYAKLRFILKQKSAIVLVLSFQLLEKYFGSVCGKKIGKSLQNSLDRFWKLQKVAQRGLQICKYETSKELGKMYSLSPIFMAFIFTCYM